MFEGGIKVVDVKGGKELRIYGAGFSTWDREAKKWENYAVMATTHNPVSVWDTNNMFDVRSRKESRNCKGAKLIYSWERGNYIDDPYNRPYKVGVIQCEVWDYRGVLGSDKDIEDCVPYEIYEMMKIKGAI